MSVSPLRIWIIDAPSMSHCRRRVGAVQAALVPGHDPLVLLISPSRDTSELTRLGGGGDLVVLVGVPRQKRTDKSAQDYGENPPVDEDEPHHKKDRHELPEVKDRYMSRGRTHTAGAELL